MSTAIKNKRPRAKDKDDVLIEPVSEKAKTTVRASKPTESELLAIAEKQLGTYKGKRPRPKDDNDVLDEPVSGKVKTAVRANKPAESELLATAEKQLEAYKSASPEELIEIGIASTLGAKNKTATAPVSELNTELAPLEVADVAPLANAAPITSELETPNDVTNVRNTNAESLANEQAPVPPSGQTGNMTVLKQSVETLHEQLSNNINVLKEHKDTLVQRNSKNTDVQKREKNLIPTRLAVSLFKRSGKAPKGLKIRHTHALQAANDIAPHQSVVNENARLEMELVGTEEALRAVTAMFTSELGTGAAAAAFNTNAVVTNRLTELPTKEIESVITHISVSPEMQQKMNDLHTAKLAAECARVGERHSQVLHEITHRGLSHLNEVATGAFAQPNDTVSLENLAVVTAGAAGMLNTAPFNTASRGNPPASIHVHTQPAASGALANLTYMQASEMYRAGQLRDHMESAVESMQARHSEQFGITVHESRIKRLIDATIDKQSELRENNSSETHAALYNLRGAVGSIDNLGTLDAARKIKRAHRALTAIDRGDVAEVNNSVRQTLANDANKPARITSDVLASEDNQYVDNMRAAPKIRRGAAARVRQVQAAAAEALAQQLSTVPTAARDKTAIEGVENADTKEITYRQAAEIENPNVANALANENEPEERSEAEDSDSDGMASDDTWWDNAGLEDSDHEQEDVGSMANLDNYLYAAEGNGHTFGPPNEPETRLIDELRNGNDAASLNSVLSLSTGLQPRKQMFKKHIQAIGRAAKRVVSARLAVSAHWRALNNLPPNGVLYFIGAYAPHGALYNGKRSANMYKNSGIGSIRTSPFTILKRRRVEAEHANTEHTIEQAIEAARGDPAQNEAARASAASTAPRV